MSIFDTLMAYERDTQALGQIAGRLGWDQETMMPRGAGPQRGEEMAAIEAVLHARRSSPQVAEWLAAAEVPDAVGAAQLREIKRSYERSVKVPADLARRIARVTSEAQGKWAAARADEDVAAFLPVLEEVVALKREEGQALAAGGDVYDAMIEDYEHGTSAAEIAAIFDAMRPGLVDLRARVLDKPAPQALQGSFPEGAQMKLTRKLAKAFGYDMSHGRVDKAVHPFSSGSGLDVRITTRTSEEDPFNCFYSTIHEVSQSRIYENQIGRGAAFTSWLYGEMRDSFGDFGISDADAFYKAVNRVHKGYIRTEADELQYNLHIMLRFDLERALMAGDLEVGDLEAAWNDRFEADFGYGVDKPSNGCLQDVHWSVGLFGYFPTYSLGNVYAGCLNKKMRADLPKLDAELATGNTASATNWLRQNLQQHGGLRSPQETITLAAGTPPSPAPLMQYLEEKFTGLYDL
jgi:carboxypeptidase Taq